MNRVNIACVGAGYWGKNLVRVFHDLPEVHLSQVCDADPKIRAAIQQQYPEIQTGADYDLLLADESIDGVVLAVPAVHHYALARKALEQGKHVYIEKPMTLNSTDAEHLIELAEEHDRVLMVGHLLEYHPAVQMLRRLIESGELGDIYAST
jgi:UDP-2-acetamido-3-amino-2,3-dideoxy-glucuronate N-acetyltransferase